MYIEFHAKIKMIRPYDLSCSPHNCLDFTEYLSLGIDKPDTTNGILYRFTGVGGHIIIICFETVHSTPLSKQNNYVFHYARKSLIT